MRPRASTSDLPSLRRLAYEAVDCGSLSPELAAGIRRVKGVKQLGRGSGNWLSLDECSTLLSAVRPEHLRGKRDHAMLSNRMPENTDGPVD